MAGKSCPTCGAPVQRGWQGRPAVYCGKRCRQAAYRARLAAERAAEVAAMLRAELVRLRGELADASGELAAALARVADLPMPHVDRGIPSGWEDDVMRLAETGGRLASRMYDLAAAHANPGGAVTKLERWLFAALDDDGITYERFAPVGRSVADALLPGYRVIIEADGVFWHRRRESADRRRDADLMAAGYTVVHLTDLEMTSERAARALVAEVLAKVRSGRQGYRPPLLWLADDGSARLSSPQVKATGRENGLRPKLANCEVRPEQLAIGRRNRAAAPYAPTGSEASL